MNQLQNKIMCPVCGGSVFIEHEDKVNLCSYCASPVLGPNQSKNCTNHTDVLATEVCHVCGELICDKCVEKRVGDYGGKLLTIVNCKKEDCVAESQWARPLNEEYQKLANMDWADKADNFVLRITGVGAVLIMVFELIFILGMLYFQYFTSHGVLLPRAYLPGDLVIIHMIFGNILGAVLLQTALQVYDHEKQLVSGVLLFILLAIEVTYLLWRGLYFKLLLLEDPLFLNVIFIAFLFGAILVFVGSLGAIFIGNKKRVQMKRARRQLNLTVQREFDDLKVLRQGRQRDQ